MKRLITISAAFLLLVAVLTTTGCTAMPYQGSYAETEVIIIRDPWPRDPGPCWPEPPIVVADSQPLPTRNSPLTKQNDSGSPRVKTPRGDRGGQPSRTKLR